MPDVHAIHKQITARVQELEKLLAPLQAEYEQLKQVSTNLTGGSTPTPSAPPTARRGRRSAATGATATRSRTRRAASSPRAKRGPQSGGRADEALRLVTTTPGITIRELATAMRLGSPNYLYRLLPQLERDGKVAKKGRGYHASETPSA